MFKEGVVYVDCNNVYWKKKNKRWYMLTPNRWVTDGTHDWLRSTMDRDTRKTLKELKRKD